MILLSTIDINIDDVLSAGQPDTYLFAVDNVLYAAGDPDVFAAYFKVNAEHLVSNIILFRILKKLTNEIYSCTQTMRFIET